MIRRRHEHSSSTDYDGKPSDQVERRGGGRGRSKPAGRLPGDEVAASRAPTGRESAVKAVADLGEGQQVIIR